MVRVRPLLIKKTMSCKNNYSK